jgi:hypothetical protein
MRISLPSNFFQWTKQSRFPVRGLTGLVTTFSIGIAVWLL